MLLYKILAISVLIIDCGELKIFEFGVSSHGITVCQILKGNKLVRP
jgi:hypothetical protein